MGRLAFPVPVPVPVPLQILLLGLLESEFAEPCDQPKRDRAAGQSQRAEKPVPASHARSGPREPKGRGGGRLRPPGPRPEAAGPHARKLGGLGRHVTAGRRASSPRGPSADSRGVLGAGRSPPPSPSACCQAHARDAPAPWPEPHKGCPSLPGKVARLRPGGWLRTGLRGPGRRPRAPPESPPPPTGPRAAPFDLLSGMKANYTVARLGLHSSRGNLTGNRRAAN